MCGPRRSTRPASPAAAGRPPCFKARTTHPVIAEAHIGVAQAPGMQQPKHGHQQQRQHRGGRLLHRLRHEGRRQQRPAVSGRRPWSGGSGAAASPLPIDSWSSHRAQQASGEAAAETAAPRGFTAAALQFRLRAPAPAQTPSRPGNAPSDARLDGSPCFNQGGAAALPLFKEVPAASARRVLRCNAAKRPARRPYPTLDPQQHTSRVERGERVTYARRGANQRCEADRTAGQERLVRGENRSKTYDSGRFVSGGRTSGLVSELGCKA